ncbi:thymidylate kinase [mine drainage metagenome]|uniref:dTMP kinase n=1 Tax=mine drainage metagenome TaxID=410659 RepID=A0A1J5QT09_9ZZZZ
MRGVLAIPIFRKLWWNLGVSSLGDWIGLLATTALAKEFAGDNYAKANVAIAGIFMLRLLPSIFIGPIAGVIADRFDRRRVMYIGDVLRALFTFSIPLIHEFWWLYTATAMGEIVTLFWGPAKDATVPNLVPRERLQAANQVSLLAAYGSAPIAAILFSLMAVVSGALASVLPFFKANPVDLAFYIDTATGVYSAITIYRLKAIPKNRGRIGQGAPGITKALLDGWKFIGKTRDIRGLVIGMFGAFVAAGAVIGLGRTFVGDLGGGNAAYGLLFGVLFAGLAVGMGVGPRVLEKFPKQRIFGLAIIFAGGLLALLAVVANLEIALLVTIALGACAGVAWVTGFTLLGSDVADDVRGRTFAFVQSLIRVTLLLVLAMAPALAAAVGQRKFGVGRAVLHFNGSEATLLLGGVFAVVVGVVSYRQMGDGMQAPSGARKGIFIAFEGVDGAGKSTQAAALKTWLEARGHTVILTHEPGGTGFGRQLRRLLSDESTADIAPRAEALLYAADRADHVYEVIRPALDRGEIVISDRYVDSFIAYEEAGRVLSDEDLLLLVRWASEALVPNLTVVLDISPTIGLGRCGELDRMERKPIEFHERVRRSFRQMAHVQPNRYLIVDANQPEEVVTEIIRKRFEEFLANAEKK